MRLIFYLNRIIIQYCLPQNNLCGKLHSAGVGFSNPHNSAGIQILKQPSASQLQSFSSFFKWHPLRLFSTSEKRKSQNSSQMNKMIEDSHKRFTEKKLIYWNCCMTRSIVMIQPSCSRCLISDAWPFFKDFQKLLSKCWVTFWVWSRNSLWTIPWLLIKQIWSSNCSFLLLGVLKQFKYVIPCSGASFTAHNQTKTQHQ